MPRTCSLGHEKFVLAHKWSEGPLDHLYPIVLAITIRPSQTRRDRDRETRHFTYVDLCTSVPISCWPLLVDLPRTFCPWCYCERTLKLFSKIIDIENAKIFLLPLLSTVQRKFTSANLFYCVLWNIDCLRIALVSILEISINLFHIRHFQNFI